MRDIILLLLIAGCIPVTIVRPFFGLLVWSWISYMVPHRLGYGFMRTMPVAALVGVTLLLAFLFSKESKKLPNNHVVYFYFGLLLWWTLSVFVHPPSEDGLVQVDTVLKIHIFIILSLMMLTSRERIQQLVLVIALSIGFFGVKGGFFTLITGGGARVWGPPGGFIEGNNELGLAILMIIPLLWFCHQHTRNAWYRRGLGVSVFLCVLAALGTQSRGALLAGCAMFLWFFMKSKNKLPIVMAIMIVVPTVIAFMPQSWHDRMATIQIKEKDAPLLFETDTSDWCGKLTAKVQINDASAGGRINAWCMAINVAKANVFGGGFDAFTHANFAQYAPSPADFHDAHSIYFQTLGEHGFVGLLIFLSLFISAALLGRRTEKIVKGKPDLEWAGQLSAMLQVSLMAYAVGGAFLGLSYFDLPYHLVVLLVCTYTVARNTVVSGSSSVRELNAVEKKPMFRFAGMPGRSTVGSDK